MRKFRKKLRKAKSKEEARYYARIIEYFQNLKEEEPLIKAFSNVKFGVKNSKG